MKNTLLDKNTIEFLKAAIEHESQYLTNMEDEVHAENMEDEVHAEQAQNNNKGKVLRKRTRSYTNLKLALDRVLAALETANEIDSGMFQITKNIILGKRHFELNPKFYEFLQTVFTGHSNKMAVENMIYAIESKNYHMLLLLLLNQGNIFENYRQTKQEGRQRFFNNTSFECPLEFAAKLRDDAAVSLMLTYGLQPNDSTMLEKTKQILHSVAGDQRYEVFTDSLSV